MLLITSYSTFNMILRVTHEAVAGEISYFHILSLIMKVE